jgi:glycosyltransferase involved in cell wall biosynthesis
MSGQRGSSDPGVDVPEGELVSIIIAVRNGVDTLQRALDSVAQQTYQRIQLIVIDGASTDDTQAVIQANSDRIGFWMSEPDTGVYQAWNRALDHAIGDWICFLGADDEIASDEAVAKAAEVLASLDRSVRVAYGAVDILDNDGHAIRRVGVPWEIAGVWFRDHMAIPHQATFHRREVFDDLGRFDESYRIAGDYEFLLREVLARPPAYIPDVVVVKMGSGGLSSRTENQAGMLAEFQRARYTHGLVDRPPERSPVVRRALARQWLMARVGERPTALVPRTTVPSAHAQWCKVPYPASGVDETRPGTALPVTRSSSASGRVEMSAGPRRRLLSRSSRFALQRRTGRSSLSSGPSHRHWHRPTPTSTSSWLVTERHLRRLRRCRRSSIPGFDS